MLLTKHSDYVTKIKEKYEKRGWEMLDGHQALCRRLAPHDMKSRTRRVGDNACLVVELEEYDPDDVFVVEKIAWRQLVNIRLRVIPSVADVSHSLMEANRELT